MMGAWRRFIRRLREPIARRPHASGAGWLLPSSLRRLGDAVGRATARGIVPRKEGLAYQAECYTLARRVTDLARPRQVRALLPLWRRDADDPSELVRRADRHLDRSLAFFDRGIDAEAAKLAADEPFEDRVSAAIAMLESATETRRPE